MKLTLEGNDRRLSGRTNSCDPVSEWLKAQPDRARGSWHSVSFLFDGARVLARSKSADVIAYLRRHVAAYYPDETSAVDQQPGCCIEINLIDPRLDRRIILPVGQGVSMKGALVLPPPHAVIESDEFVHMRWDAIESFWRPFDLLVSLRFSTTPNVRLVVVGPASCRDEPTAHFGPLRVKVDKRCARAGSRASTKKPGRRHASMAEIADLVRVMTVRARGHFCLHAATVASGGRGILLMGPSGSGKTTTALSLLRGGYGMLSDEHSVLNASTKGVQVTGFRGAARVAGQAPVALAELERTLQCGGEGKTPYPPQEPRPSKPSQWLRPAVMFFLRIQPGACHHRVSRLPPEEAFVRVTGQVLDPTNPFRKEAQAEAVIRLVENCPAYELILGNNLRSLPGLVHSVVEGLP